MSYERAWVLGVFGTALVKRDGGAPDRPAAKRIRFAHELRYKTITLCTHAVLKAAHTFLQRRVVVFQSPPQPRELESDF
jgi:hypothetical protein